MAKKKVQNIIRIDHIEKYAGILLEIDSVYKTPFIIANGSCYIISTLSNNEEIEVLLATQIETDDVTYLKGKMKLELYYTEKVI